MSILLSVGYHTLIMTSSSAGFLSSAQTASSAATAGDTSTRAPLLEVPHHRGELGLAEVADAAGDQLVEKWPC